MPTCPECEGDMELVLGGSACHDCQIFFSPYGFKENWEIR